MYSDAVTLTNYITASSKHNDALEGNASSATYAKLVHSEMAATVISALISLTLAHFYFGMTGKTPIFGVWSKDAVPTVEYAAEAYFHFTGVGAGGRYEIAVVGGVGKLLKDGRK
jgi:hypothetical protein